MTKAVGDQPEPAFHGKSSITSSTSLSGSMIIKIAELADYIDTQDLLSLDEFAIEKLDQDVPLARVKCVLPELDDGATGLFI